MTSMPGDHVAPRPASSLPPFLHSAHQALSLHSAQLPANWPAAKSRIKTEWGETTKFLYSMFEKKLKTSLVTHYSGTCSPDPKLQCKGLSGALNSSKLNLVATVPNAETGGRDTPQAVYLFWALNILLRLHANPLDGTCWTQCWMPLRMTTYCDSSSFLPVFKGFK